MTQEIEPRAPAEALSAASVSQLADMGVRAVRLQFADLLGEDVHKITVFGTTADLVTITYVTGSLSNIRKSLITLGLLSG